MPRSRGHVVRLSRARRWGRPGPDGHRRFPERPQFSERFSLHGSDQTAIRALFDQAAFDYLGTSENRDLAVEAGGEWVIVYRWAERVEPARLDVFVKEARALVRLLAEKPSRPYG